MIVICQSGSCCIWAVSFTWYNTAPTWLINNNISIVLTHWGRVTHICVSELTTIGSVNGLSPGLRQAIIIWTNDGILLIQTSGTNFSEILSKIHSFWFKKMHLKMSSAKWRLFRLCLNELWHFILMGDYGKGCEAPPAQGKTTTMSYAAGMDPLLTWLNTLRQRQIATISHKFSNAFSWIKMYEFRLRFQWNLFRFQINNIPALVQIITWRRPGYKPLSGPMVASLLTHICTLVSMC